MISLGVNIDHVATLRNARGENDPALIELALLAQNTGADLITVHLREDRRHIRDADIFDLRKNLKVPLNFEMSLSDEILGIALQAKPTTACIVPERREEVTTEGGLDVFAFAKRIAEFTRKLHDSGIETYLFIEPDEQTVKASAEAGVKGIEFHTGAYARAFTIPGEKQAELERLKRAAETAHNAGLAVHAGHGLNIFNVGAVCKIPHVTELNIGHAIIARSLTLGLAGAITEMRQAMGLSVKP
jgi:pyridoxine 5-phosphate synthase